MHLLSVEEALKAAEESSEICLRCPICGEHKDGLQKLMNHLLFKHIGHNETIHCTYCSDVFTDHALAHRHIEKHKANGIPDAALTFTGPTPAHYANATKIVQLAVYRICTEKKAEVTTKSAESSSNPSTSKAPEIRKEPPRQERPPVMGGPQGHMKPDDRFCKKIPLERLCYVRDPRANIGPPRFAIKRARMNIPPIPFARDLKPKRSESALTPQPPVDTPPVANPTPTPSPKPPPPPSTPPPADSSLESAERKRKNTSESTESFDEDPQRPPQNFMPPMFPPGMVPQFPYMMCPPQCMMIPSPSPGFVQECRNFWNTPPPMPHMTACGPPYGSFPGPSGFGGNQVVHGPSPGWTPNCGGPDFRMQGASHHHQYPPTSSDALRLPPPPPPPPPMEFTPRRPKEKEVGDGGIRPKKDERPPSNSSAMSISPPPPAVDSSRMSRKRHEAEQEKLRFELEIAKKVKKEEPL